jgi:predicted heme/steroid binding protein
MKETGDMKMKEYTQEELLEYNGKNGKVYIVYDGQVYDLSNSYLWEDGTHQGLHDSGKDLTQEMDEAPHGPEVFKDYPVVGTLKK